jgi:hypothetical protein
MSLSRRQALGAALAVPLAAQAARAVAAPPSLPDKASFAATPLAYLDSASTHPVSLGAKAAADAYLAGRTLDPVAAARKPVDRAALIAKFAALMGADADEITWVQSTTMGEQAVLRALGFPHAGGRVVTDTLHFYAAFPMYQEMAKQGVDVAWVQAREGRIAPEDMARAITPGTKLVSISAVSTYNGFQHDLKAISAMAHKVGALVYADIIHAAGAVPIDLHDSGVDFAACATYKWLMGDFGLGFLYVRRGVADQLPRSEYGYYGFAAPGAPPGIGLSPPQTHVFPLDPPGDTPTSYVARRGARPFRHRHLCPGDQRHARSFDQLHLGPHRAGDPGPCPAIDRPAARRAAAQGLSPHHPARHDQPAAELRPAQCEGPAHRSAGARAGPHVRPRQLFPHLAIGVQR